VFNFRDYIVEVLVHLCVGNAYDSAALLFQPGCTQKIVFHLFAVAFTIYFDDQMYLGTVKIDNKATDRVLPAEFKPVKLDIP